MADPYHGLAADYDWIFDDGAVDGGAAINQPATMRPLQRIGPGGDVLDAAFGTGIDAAARFRREGLAIAVQRCQWADLPAAIDGRFDVVLCTGNVLVQAAGRDTMVREQHLDLAAARWCGAGEELQGQLGGVVVPQCGGLPQHCDDHRECSVMRLGHRLTGCHGRFRQRRPSTSRQRLPHSACRLGPMV